MQYAFSATLPLPPHTDPLFRWEIKDRHGNNGVRLTDLRIFPVNRGGAVPSAANWAELEQRLRQSMYHSVAEQALHPDVVDTHHETPLEDKERRRPMCVNACQFKNDKMPWVTYWRPTLNTSMRDFVADFAELLLTKFSHEAADVEGWGIGDNDNRHWVMWKQRPSLSCVWIVAVRRSFSHDGLKVCYWPELEVRI